MFWFVAVTFYCLYGSLHAHNPPCRTLEDCISLGFHCETNHVVICEADGRKRHDPRCACKDLHLSSTHAPVTSTHVSVTSTHVSLTSTHAPMTSTLASVNGGWSYWEAWSSCTASCDQGTQTRHRTCSNPAPSNGGLSCDGEISQIQICSAFPCAVDGYMSEWGSWGSCTVTCGGGFQVRTRTCHDPIYGGKPCEGDTAEINPSCNYEPCPVDGYMSEWGTWRSCTVTCGGGFRMRKRTCHDPINGGKPCVGDTVEIDPTCNYQPCPDPSNTSTQPTTTTTAATTTATTITTTTTTTATTKIIAVNGGWSNWTGWSTCSATCDQGTQVRSRSCTDPVPSNGGLGCSGENEQNQTCTVTPCPVDGYMGEWSSWGACSATCGGGFQMRTRTCHDPLFGGKNCTGDVVELNPSCNNQSCSTSSSSSQTSGMPCPFCDDALNCVWNQTCSVGSVCMIRSFQTYPFTTHCIDATDCEIMKGALQTHCEVFCCADHACLSKYLGV